MLCLKEGYHGWSVASDAVSTSLADNPQALTTRPDWVHAAPAPNSFRGQFRGPDAGNDYVEATRPLMDAVRESGEGLAGVIAESLCGNAGGIVLPDGYLSQIYALVRDAGDQGLLANQRPAEVQPPVHREAGAVPDRGRERDAVVGAGHVLTIDQHARHPVVMVHQ